MVELQSPVLNDEVFGMQRLAVQPRGGKGGGEEKRENGEDRSGQDGNSHSRDGREDETQRGTQRTRGGGGGDVRV